MKKTWKLRKTRQCDKCPWKVSTNPHDIPNGYSVERHQNLKITISDGVFNPNKTELQKMACHESQVDDSDMCIGWMNHQIGVGNNFLLRFQMMSCENFADVELSGEQHQCFEDTLPNV